MMSVVVTKPSPAYLVQKNLKRLIAYSSITPISGYALIGLSPRPTSKGVGSMLVFMVLYMVDVTAFLACPDGAAARRASRWRPWPTSRASSRCAEARHCVTLAALSFSFLGLPPFSGFWGKFFVFRAALNAGLWPVAVAGLVARASSPPSSTCASSR